MESVIIYTKQFPFGLRESYLLDEIPLLREKFDLIFFYPYAEFEFNYDTARLKEDHQIKILNFNLAPKNINLSSRLLFSFNASKLLIREIIFSRQGIMGLKRIKQNFQRLYHFAAQAQILGRWLQEQSGKFIHYHYWLHDGLVISEMSSIAKRQPHFARAHSIDLYHKDWPLGGYLPFEKIKLKLAKRIYSVSKHGLAYLRANHPQWDFKFNYQPLGVSLDHQPIIQQPLPKILTISFIGKVKNLNRMIEFMKLLKQDFTWVHIGSGTKESEAQLIDDCNKENISFEYLGYLTKTQINSYLTKNQMAFFANTSSWEGVPVSMMEAGIYGIPFIATAIPGNLEIVNPTNGFIMPLTGDLQKLADQISFCYKNEKIWKTTAVEAQKTIFTQYNAQNNYSVFFDEIKTIA
ncbi:MAG: hypothetical protein RLY35_775 [Bacteroidota bacterium]|jgi:glycosyltransferase involved in cell wall biosynthesis